MGVASDFVTVLRGTYENFAPNLYALNNILACLAGGCLYFVSGYVARFLCRLSEFRLRGVVSGNLTLFDWNEPTCIKYHNTSVCLLRKEKKT